MTVTIAGVSRVYLDVFIDEILKNDMVVSVTTHTIKKGGQT